MSITLEQVERLREKASVSYEEAKAALEQSGGDLLEALILLERQGRVAGGPRDCSFFTTRPGGEVPPTPTQLVTPPPPKGGKDQKHAKDGGGNHPGFWDQFMEVLRHIWAILRHSLSNQFEVWRNGEMTTSMPVLLLIILVCVAFPIAVPALIIGLFFGCTYHFTGPDLNREKVNEVMDTVSATVNDVVDTVRAEVRKATGKKKD